MDELTTPTGLRIAGRWLQPGDAVPGDVIGFDYEKAASKGMIEAPKGTEIVNPGREPEPSSPEAADTSELQGQLDAMTKDRDGLQAKLDAATTKLTTAKSDLTAAKNDLKTEKDRVKVLEGEAKKVKPLPEDALARLSSVEGIDEALAKLALAALTKAE